MPDKIIKEKLLILLNSQVTGVLATESEHQPYASLIAFSFTDDLRKIIFATPNNTTKFRNLVQNPHVSVVIDSRQNNPENFSCSTAVTVLGVSRELKGDTKLKKQQIHSGRLPGLADFLAMEVIALFEIEVKRYIITEGLNSTVVYVP